MNLRSKIQIIQIIMENKFKTIIDNTQLCITTYNEITHSVDTHLTDFFEANKIRDKHEKVFIKVIFYGVIRYAPLLKVNLLFRSYLSIYKR